MVTQYYFAEKRWVYLAYSIVSKILEVHVSLSMEYFIEQIHQTSATAFNTTSGVQMQT